VKYLLKNKQHLSNFQDIEKLEFSHYTSYKYIADTEKILRKIHNDRTIKNKLQIHPEKTAISRKTPTLPLRNALKYFQKYNIPIKNKLFFEIGKGKSVDALFLEQQGCKVYSYDPHYFPLKNRDEGRENYYFYPDEPHEKADFILLSYVLNVILKDTRQIIANLCRKIIQPQGRIIIGVRNDIEAIKPTWEKYQDGYITPRGTFQCFFPTSLKYKIESQSRLEKLFLRKTTWIGRATWLN